MPTNSTYEATASYADTYRQTDTGLLIHWLREGKAIASLTDHLLAGQTRKRPSFVQELRLATDQRIREELAGRGLHVA